VNSCSGVSPLRNCAQSWRSVGKFSGSAYVKTPADSKELRLG
jgi:hypothetical protein